MHTSFRQWNNMLNMKGIVREIKWILAILAPSESARYNKFQFYA